MNAPILVLGTALLFFCCGCESVKRVSDDSRYFGGFRKKGHYVTKVETIITSDKQNAVYGEMLFQPKRLFLVPANTGAATNYARGKFSGLRRADPVREIGRLPAGSTLEFICTESVVVPLESLRPAMPFARVLIGPFRGTEVCVYHLCSDQFVWGWPQTKTQRSDLGDGRQVEVYSPCGTFLTYESKQ